MMTDTPPTSKSASPVVAETKDMSENYMQEAVAYVIEGKEPSNLSAVGKLCFRKGSKDEKHCNEIRQLLLDYISGTEPQPFSIVVFGPPGSGKSFYVRELVASLRNKNLPEGKEEKLSIATEEPKKERTIAEKLAELSEINLAQLYTPHDLSKRFNSARQQKMDTKVFFFDEFDSSLDGVSLGWLRWFLAPMQDGKFFHDGQLEEIGKSIFIFAGGTASTLQEFQERARIDPDAYHEKKVPDFISRLRGSIDITGINDPGDDRPVRRALILRHKLAKKFSIKQGPLPVGEEFARRLLSNAHYIHGTRSMEALVEMSSWKEGETFNPDHHLPPPYLMELHVSRGRLNGIRVGISAGLSETYAEEFLSKLSSMLFENGADLAYGGNLRKAGTLRAMVKAADNTPEDLLKREEKQRIRNYLGYPAYQDPELKALNDEVKDQVKVFLLSTLSKFECHDLAVPAENHNPKKPEEDYFTARPRTERSETEYSPKRHLAWSLSLFRMRVRMIQDLTALIAFGGKDDGESWGRFSGVAEEVMLALAMGKPLYLLGNPGGATQAVGRLLGLDETLTNPDLCLDDIGSIEHSAIYRHFKHAFALPEHPNLPRTIGELRSYLFEHGVMTSNWPWNGLQLDENRQLFHMPINEPNWGKCANLIIRGLTRLDWKASPVSVRQKKRTQERS